MLSKDNPTGKSIYKRRPGIYYGCDWKREKQQYYFILDSDKKACHYVTFRKKHLNTILKTNGFQNYEIIDTIREKKYRRCEELDHCIRKKIIILIIYIHDWGVVIGIN